MCIYLQNAIGEWCLAQAQTENGPFLLFAILAVAVISIVCAVFLTLLPFALQLQSANKRNRARREWRELNGHILFQPEQFPKWEYPREQKPEPADKYDERGHIVPENDGLFTWQQISRMSQEQVDELVK